MANGAASESVLGELHGKVAKVMTRALDQIGRAQDAFDEADETGSLEETLATRPEVPAALLGVMTKFLNENKITCTPEDSESMSDMERALAEKRTRRRPRRSVGNVVHAFDDEG